MSEKHKLLYNDKNFFSSSFMKSYYTFPFLSRTFTLVDVFHRNFFHPSSERVSQIRSSDFSLVKNWYKFIKVNKR